MRRRLTYANVATTLALVFAMSGGALAARHYLINSTKQISPKVLKKLQGKTGRRGATGPRGLQGPAGEPGPSGSFVSTLPSGNTLRGSYAVMTNRSGQHYEVGVSFPFPLPSNPTMHRIAPGGAPTPECPGSVAAPEARPGNLCVYEEHLTNSRGIVVGGASRYGWIADIWELLGSNEEAVSYGTWAVTAP